jgi:DNA-binding NarL/FixJ family response regulator
MRLVFETRPDLAIIDISLQNGHGLELCKEIRAWNEQGNGEIKMLVVTAHDEEMYAERALHAGASGFLNKGETTKRLLDAMHSVMNGKIYLTQSITDRILTRLISGHYDETRSPLENLSDRELEVFELIGKGMTTREVADSLNLSPKTVETYRENLKLKLNLENANQLVCAAVHHMLESS